MTEDGYRERIGTYRCIYCCGQQWKLCYIDRSDRITSTRAAALCIRSLDYSLTLLTEDGYRERIGTYRCIYCCGQQWKLCYIDRSDRITSTRGAAHCIG